MNDKDTERDTAESAATEAERAREVAEDARQEHERAREHAETARKAGESARITADAERDVALESVHDTAETLKLTLEHMKVVEDLRRTVHAMKTGEGPEKN